MKPEYCLDKQTIEYTHTIVPASMRSPYWKYFGFPSNSANKILTRQKIICTLCATAITYNKNTSNLRTHLIARHPEQLHEMHQQQQLQNFGFTPSHNGDVPSQTQTDIERGQKMGTTKRINSTDQNLDSVIKIRRLNIAQQEINNVTTHNEEAISGTQDKQIHSEDLKVCLEEYHCQSEEIHSQIEVKPNACNEGNDSIIINEGTIAYLGSETINALHRREVENLDTGFTNDDNDDNIDNDVDEFTDSETVILDTAISQKEMLDYSPVPTEEMGHSSDKKVSHIELLADMLVKDLLSFNVLHGLGFKHFVNSFGIANFDKYAVEKKIQSDFTKMQFIIKKYIATHLLQQDEPYSLSIETYINNEAENIFSVYINLINFGTDCKLESILYDEIICNKETELYDVLQDFDLSHCAAIVTTNMDNIIIQNFCITHGIEVVPCLDALLTRCLNLIFQQDPISELFYKIRKLCQNSQMITPNLHYPWSKLKLLQDFLDNSNASDLHNMNSKISADLESFMAFMNPLKITLDTINAEPLPLCTLVRPLMVKLFEEHFLIFKTDGNSCTQAARKIINSELRNSIEKCPFLSEVVLFDGRFQHDFIQPGQLVDHEEQQTAFLDGYNRTELVAAVCQRFQHLLITPSLDIKSEQKDKYDVPQIVPQSSLRLFFHRISDAASAANGKTFSNTFSKVSQPKDPIDLEWRRYKCEPSLDLEQCPIDWWQSQSKQYKLLYKIAKYYLCVPCYAVNWKISSNDGVEMQDRSVRQQKRNALSYQQPVDRCLWYMHYNRSLYDKIKPKPPLIVRKSKEV